MATDTTTAQLPIRSIRDFNLKGRRVFLRLDFNVPLSAKAPAGAPNVDRIVEDDSRIQEALPTIKYAIENGAKVIIASHLGRPDGKANPDFSLEPIATHLAGLLKQEVTLADDCVGEGIELLTKGLKNGQVMLLENLRFHADEEENGLEFIQRLAQLADIYITDAFGTAHRKHASTYGLPAALTNKGMGFLIEKELKFLERLLKAPETPFLAVLGGSKVSDKIKTIQSLFKRVSGIAIGGAMAHAFWEVKKIPIPEGAIHPKPADVEAARAILDEAGKRGINIVLPVDTNLGFDIGPKSVQLFCDFLRPGKTIFWNGPLGWFEKPEYAKGTYAIAEFMSKLSALRVVGGGDTVSAIKHSGFASGFDHLSTGGGAVLEYLENEGLPGIDIIKDYSKVPPTETKARYLQDDPSEG